MSGGGSPLRKSTVVRLLTSAAAVAALSAGPLASPGVAEDGPSATCSIPVGSGVVTPSGGNTATLNTTTAYAAEVSCHSLDSLFAYSATLEAVVKYSDGTACGSRIAPGTATLGQVALRISDTCTTPAWHSQVHSLQTISVRVTTNHGVDSGWRTYPIA